MTCTTAECALELDGGDERVTLLRDGVEAVPAMLKAVRCAVHEIVLEMYWLDGSVLGLAFVEALTERARAGVAVRVLYDAFGSFGVDRAIFVPLREAGGQVVEFNPVAPWRRRFRAGWISQRDHRKMLAVDGRVAFVGGLNLGLPWLCREEGGGGWRDDVAMVVGPAAARVRTLFFDTWVRQGGDAAGELPPRTARERAAETRRELKSVTAVLGHDAWGARRVLRRAYLSRIAGSERRVLIANAYFVPDLAVQRALRRAARRGVEVRVICPKESDVPPVQYAGEWLYRDLMRAGVRIHQWTGSVLHAKTLLVDDWATTGSYNLDYRSLRYNLEANLASADPSFVRQVEASMRRDLAEHCLEVDPAAWARRPWMEKLRSSFFYLMRKVL